MPRYDDLFTVLALDIYLHHLRHPVSVYIAVDLTPRLTPFPSI